MSMSIDQDQAAAGAVRPWHEEPPVVPGTTTQRTPLQSAEAIRDLTRELKRYLVGRDEAIEMMALAMTAAEPMLLLGPPGTAKSDLIYKFSEAIGLTKGDYFEYMITAFTEPSEIVGPVDILELRNNGVYRRVLDGKLADAAVVFLDEIFNGNSAILNTLLTVMNERKIYDAGKPFPLEKLVGFFAASNQIPEREELAALKDRFVIKVELRSVQRDHFDGLIDAGLANDVNKAHNRKPWTALPVSVRDFTHVRRHVSGIMLEYDEKKQKLRFPEHVHRTFRNLVAALASQGIVLSDREVIKLYRLIILRAYLLRGARPDTVELDDLSLLRYVAESEEQFPVVRELVDQAIEDAR